MANLDISKIDWKKLRQQKRWLIEQYCAHADGLVSLIDWLQDEANRYSLSVPVGYAPSTEEIFGRSDKDGYYIEEFDHNLEYLNDGVA